MERKRILELALERLQQQRMILEADIETIRAELRGGTRTAKAGLTTTPAGRRRKRTLAEKEAQSERMRAYWAAKAKKLTTAGGKRRPRTAAQRKAQSIRMKQAWARRKAEEAKKNK